MKLRKWVLRKFGDTDRDWLDRMYNPMQRVICLFKGHDPTRDHCGLPEHDFCFWCQKPMPGAWRRI